MSCLTRKLQQYLAKYLSQHQQDYADKPCQWIKDDLVNKGVCPNYVTLDQLELLLEQTQLFKHSKKRFFGMFA